MGSIICAQNTVKDTYNPASYAGVNATILIQPQSSCVNDTALIRYARPDGGVEAVFGFVQTQLGAATADFVIQGSSCGYSEKLRIAGNFVGIGISTPCATLDVYKQGSGTTGTGDNLIVRGGNNNSAFGSNQIRFGYGGGIGYSHAIKSRHNSGQNAQNSLDFFLWTVSDCVETVGSKNVMTLESTGNVGIGTCSPANALHVYRAAGSAALALQVGGNYGYFFGNGCCMGIASDSGASGVKFHISRQAPDDAMLITNTGKVSVGSTSPNGQLSVAVDQSVNNQHFNIVGTQTSYSQEYSFGIPTSTKDLRIYDGTAGAVRLTLTCLGNLGLNTTTPGTYKLNVNGAFYAAGSSKEYKTSICEYNTDSCMFMKLKPVTYDYKEEWKHLGKQLKSGTQIGLIAEDTAEVFPELAVLKEEENEQVVRNVDYEKLSVILLSEVQKLRREVDDLKHK